ncbi:MAG TPA: YcxB family protein [Phycisphaerae bacterium]|nr:YcxB family protein [Phycisphaerae bacterium]
MDIRLQFTLTPDDYCDFQFAYMKHRRSLTPRNARGMRSPRLIFWGALVLIMVIFICFMVLVTPPSAPGAAAAPAPPPIPPGQAILEMLPFPVFFIMVAGLVIWVGRSKFLYRRFAPQVLRVGEPKTAEITDGQLTVQEPGATSVFQWNYFMRFIETRSSFLLFTIPRGAHILPKRAFTSPAELNEFRAFAQAHVGNVPIGFPVQAQPSA